MKRFCVFALVIIMLLSTSALAAKYPIMLKDDGIKVIVRDAYYKHSDFDDSHELVFDVEASNETKENYMITSITGYVNGWEVDAHAYISVAAGMKRKDTVYIKLNDTNLLSAADLQKLTEVKVKLAYFPEDNVMSNHKSISKKINVEWIKKHVKNHK